MKSFSFVHAADLHLGYSQYNLAARLEDFYRALQELIDRTIELKPDFMIIAGDLFHHARPSNVTLENAIKSFRRLREAGIPVLTVDGSHDSAPNTLTGTVLNPLDSAGLIYHLPRHEGACWRKEDCCYVYGVPNFRTRGKTEQLLPAFMKQNTPTPSADLFNIFVFHMALDIPDLSPPHIEAECPLELIPEHFDYYAGGHVHKPYRDRVNKGMLVYSGSTETVNYKETKNRKGFYYVEINEKGIPSPQFITLKHLRRFIVLEHDFTGLAPSKITEQALQLVKGADEDGVVVVPVLRGVLPAEARRAEVDIARLRSAAEKALTVHPIVLLHESEIPEEIIRSIFETEFKDLRSKVFEYFLQIFGERYSRSEAEKIARIAVNLIEPLAKNEEENVMQILEELLNEN